jgi:hypothetical protein
MAFLKIILRRLIAFLTLLIPRALRRRWMMRPFRPAQLAAHQALQAPAQSARTALQELLRRNGQTEFGRVHAFLQISDVGSYPARVPLRTYAEFKPYIDRLWRGEQGLLTAEPVIGFALSEGARGLPRPVPVTRSSLQQWMLAEDLLLRQALAQHPEAARGCILHLEPSPEMTTAPGGLPIQTLRQFAATLEGARSHLPHALPASLFAIRDEAARGYLIWRLAMEQPVTILRAHCPGTLTLLAEQLEALAPRLLEDLATGQVAYLDVLPTEVRHTLAQARPQKALATRLAQQLKVEGRLLPSAIWPQLKVLVCQTTGPAKTAAERLPDRFGPVSLLNPGVQTIEGVITWPWQDESGGPLALAGQYLEFLPPGGGETTIPLAELRVGQRVRPVFSGPNGLYRCVLEDLLQVLQLENGAARLAYLGRDERWLNLETGRIKEGVIAEALVSAARACALPLAAYTSWLEPAAAGETLPVPSPGGTGKNEQKGWFSRIWRRESKSTKTTALLPTLVLAIEPNDPLELSDAKRFLVAADKELSQGSTLYAELRQNQHLGEPSLVVLKRGCVARRRHRRLATGAMDGHSPLPALFDDPWPLEGEEVELRVQES